MIVHNEEAGVQTEAGEEVGDAVPMSWYAAVTVTVSAVVSVTENVACPLLLVIALAGVTCGGGVFPALPEAWSVTGRPPIGAA